MLKEVGGKTVTVGLFAFVLAALVPFSIVVLGTGGMALGLKDDKKK